MKFTIFTPTYNRAHLLSRLFESLQQLEFKDFEWLIVDDGSEDRTEMVIKEFQSKADFAVRYFKQKNQGKHTAINKGVANARGELFYIVDSDDWLPPDALDVILSYEPSLESSQIAGCAGKRMIASSKNSFPFKEKITTPLAMRYIYMYNFDMAEVYKTAVLMDYPFPYFEGEKFIPESLVWFRIAAKHNMLYFDKVIYHCEYQAGGLSDNYRSLIENNSQGSLLYFKELLGYPIGADAKIAAAKNFNSVARKNGKSHWWVFSQLGLVDYLKVFR